MDGGLRSSALIIAKITITKIGAFFMFLPNIELEKGMITD